MKSIDFQPLDKSSGNGSGSVSNSIDVLQSAMSKMPQWDAGANTSHYFADQMYCRVLFRPAGTLIIGKRHKKSHFYIVCSGTVLVSDGDSPAKEMIGPCVIVSFPGTKRAVKAITDATCLTVHRTKKRNLDRIEAQLIEPDNKALFDARNKLKELI